MCLWSICAVGQRGGLCLSDVFHQVLWCGGELVSMACLCYVPERAGLWVAWRSAGLCLSSSFCAALPGFDLIWVLCVLGIRQLCTPSQASS